LSVVRPGSFEIDPFIGVSYGINETQVMGGGNVSFAINKYILPYAEFSYFPGIGHNESGTFSTGSSYTVHYAVPLADYHAGVHIRIPIHESPIVPYAVFGLGGLSHFAFNAAGTYSTGTSTETVSVPVASGNVFAVNFGGGIRYYINQRFGVRVEAKAYKPESFFQVFGKAEFGFFFQLR
jgi:hypothetical protein